MDGVGRSLRRKAQCSPLCSQAGFCRAALCCLMLQHTGTTANTADNIPSGIYTFYSNRHIASPGFYPDPPLMQPCCLLALLLQLWSRQFQWFFQKKLSPTHIKCLSSSLWWMLALLSTYSPVWFPACRLITLLSPHRTPFCCLLAESLKRFWPLWLCLDCGPSWGDLTPNNLFPHFTEGSRSNFSDISSFTFTQGFWGAGSLFSKPSTYTAWSETRGSTAAPTAPRHGHRDTSDSRPCWHLFPPNKDTKELWLIRVGSQKGV